MADSKIEWTDATWNPTTGCTWASLGCDNCYAVIMTRRLAAMGQKDYSGLTTKKHFNGVVRNLPHKLDAPFGWKKPRMVFVNSMSDLFHKDVPNDFIANVFATMYECQWHTFQVLTKRADRLKVLQNPRFTFAMATLAHNRLKRCSPEKAAIVSVRDIEDDIRGMWPLPNAWLGVSAENQATLDERLPLLAQTPAAVRFISAEPLLGPLDVGTWFFSMMNAEKRCAIGWLIAGGESGPKARPMHPDWARGLRDQCQAAGVPFFFKQWGAWNPLTTVDNRQLLPFGDYDVETKFGFKRVGKKAAGRLLDGREWNEFPEVTCHA